MAELNFPHPAEQPERRMALDNALFVKELARYDQKLRENEEQIARLQSELQRLQGEVIRDRETNLFSLAYFHSRLAEEITRSERYRHFFSLVLIHVELTGHHSTQQLTLELKRIGQELMLGVTRRTDIITLYRRRQLVIMLPETDTKGANLLLARYQAMYPSQGRRLSHSILTYPNDAANMDLILGRLQEMSENLFRLSGLAAVGS